MKLIDWKRDYMLLGFMSLGLGLLLLIRSFLLGAYSSTWGSIKSLFLPIIFIIIFYKYIKTEGPRITLSEGAFLLGSLYCGIYFIYSLFSTLLWDSGPINVLVLILNVFISAVAWMALLYYSY